MRYLCTLTAYIALFFANFVCAGLVALVAQFDKRGVFWWPIARLWGWTIYAGAWSRIVQRGFDVFTWDQPCILMANHESYLDVPALIAVLPSPVRFVARKEVFKTPIMGQAMRATGQISIDRSNRDQAIESLSRAARQISNGRTVLVFPEGTRSKDGEIQSFKKGGFMLALEAQVPIIPVGVSGTRGLVPRGEWRFQPGVVGVAMGEPIETKGLTVEDREALMGSVRDALEAQKLNAKTLVKAARS